MAQPPRRRVIEFPQRRVHETSEMGVRAFRDARVGRRVRAGQGGVCRRDLGSARAIGRQLPRRCDPCRGGDQRQGWRAEAEARSHLVRHADQPRRRAGADAEGDRRRAVHDLRADPLRQRQGDARNGEGRADPAVRRRRGGRADDARQSVHVPHLVRPADRHAEDRELYPRRDQGEDHRAHLGEQRLRQGRPRPAAQGAQGARYPARRRRIERAGPGRLRRRHRQAQVGERRCGVRLLERRRMRADHARSA